MLRASSLERDLSKRYAIVYKQLLDIFKVFGGIAMVEMAISAYARWAEGQIRIARLKVIEDTLKKTTKITNVQLRPEVVMLSGNPNLSTLGRDVAKEVDAGLKIAIAAGAIGLISVFRKKMSLGLVWTLRTAKTAIAYAGRDAAIMSYSTRPDIIEGWIWESALLPTTCMGCIAMHGTFHPLTERLNDHQSGYCWPKPAVKGRPDFTSGEEWFRNLGKETQIKMMGPSKYAAWRAGQFDFRDLVTTYEDDTWGGMVRENSLKGILGEGARQWYGYHRAS